jgi:hypothetical protein
MLTVFVRINNFISEDKPANSELLFISIEYPGPFTIQFASVFIFYWQNIQVNSCQFKLLFICVCRFWGPDSHHSGAVVLERSGHLTHGPPALKDCGRSLDIGYWIECSDSSDLSQSVPKTWLRKRHTVLNQGNWPHPNATMGFAKNDHWMVDSGYQMLLMVNNSSSN